MLRAMITLGNLAHENAEVKGLIMALGIQWPNTETLQAAQGDTDVAGNKKTINEIKAMLHEGEEE